MTKPKDKRGGKKERPAVNPDNLARYDEERERLEIQDEARRAAPHDGRSPFRPKDSPEVRAALLDWLRKGYSKTFACDKVGISTATLDKWGKEVGGKSNWAEWAAEVARAVDEGTDYFEDEARRRAVDGIDRPIFQGGILVGFERNYSDSLMALQLQGRRPERYGKTRHEHSGPDGAPIPFKIEVEFVSSDDDKGRK